MPRCWVTLRLLLQIHLPAILDANYTSRWVSFGCKSTVDDTFPNDLLEWGGQYGDNSDTDRDGDGISNDYEIQAGTDPNNIASVPSDLDGDGIPDSLDSDADGDGIEDNIVPIADAGSDQASITGLMVTLDGSTSSDLDGDILQFQCKRP